jgi:outer membrane protein assembly factor BamB
LWLLVAAPVSGASFTPGDVVVSIYPTSSYDEPRPDMYSFDAVGQFEGFFFQPFSVGDLAASNGELLIASSNSGTIARVDSGGGLLGLISTPADRIDGLAVASNGDLYVAEYSGNQLWRLDSSGNFLDMAFVMDDIQHLGIDPNDNLVYSRRSGTSSSSPLELVVFDFELGVQTTTPTEFRRIGGLAVDALGLFVVAGTTSSYYSSIVNTVVYLDASGAEVSRFVGPSGIESLAVVTTPEPGTGTLLGASLAALALLLRRP